MKKLFLFALASILAILLSQQGEALVFGYDSAPFVQIYNNGNRSIDIGGDFTFTPKRIETYSSHTREYLSDGYNWKIRAQNIFSKTDNLSLSSGFALSQYAYSYSALYTGTTDYQKDTQYYSRHSLDFIISADYKFCENISIFSEFSLLRVREYKNISVSESTLITSTRYEKYHECLFLDSPSIFTGVKISI